MSTPDLINGAFELFGGLFILNHCRVLLKAKKVAGVSILSTIFFTAWGVWNLYFYPSLGQWLSFAGGLAIFAANCCWIYLLLKYRDRKPKDPCVDGCQYSKDIGMWPEHSCRSCMFEVHP